jgi:hypothetical protein
MSVVCIISCLTVIAAASPSGTTLRKMQAIAWKDVTFIRCGKVSEVCFSGVPNEIKTGKFTFIVFNKLKKKRFKVRVIGARFINKNISLATDYQPDNTEVWYKAGDPFVMTVVSGKINIIRFRVRTGPRISSVQAGTYAAKVCFYVI